MPAVTNEAEPKRTPKFNWFRARELARNGATAPDIAKKMGVSVGAVRRILNKKSYETTTVQDNYSLNKTCATDDCNTRISNNSTVCRPHHLVSLKISVRDTTVKCSACQAWKPDESFPKDARKTARRGRRYWCKACCVQHRERTRGVCLSCGGPLSTRKNRKTGLRPTRCMTCYQAERKAA